MTTDDRIRDEKISALLSRKIDKYEYLTSEVILSRFFKVDSLKFLNISNNIDELKQTENKFIVD